MPIFQKSTYSNSLKLINVFISIDLDASLPQIGWYRTGLGTIVGNFGEPFRLTFHYLIKGQSIGLHTRSVGETLYCIIGQPEESTKNLNWCVLICPTNIYDHLLNNLGPKIWNLEALESIEEWIISPMRSWKLSSNLLNVIIFLLHFFEKK
jgi:hypothetical protein